MGYNLPKEWNYLKQNKTGKWTLVSLFDFALTKQKRLLPEKIKYEILEGFLSELLSKNISVRNILDIEGSERYKMCYTGVDILAEDESGEILLIELQFVQEMAFGERIFHGINTTVADRLTQRAEYSEVSKTCSVNIVYFDLGQGDDYVYHGKTRFTGIHENDELRLSDTQRGVFVKETVADSDPEYYILKINSFDDVVKDALDEWIYFLKNDDFNKGFTAKGMDRAREEFLYDNLTPEEQKEYNYIWRIRRDNLNYLASAQLEGRIEGIKKGREEGRIEREKLAEELEKEREEREKLEKERADLLAEINKLKQNGK
jgi:predicted transposase/invertase (TIGR01784 family)